MGKKVGAEMDTFRLAEDRIRKAYEDGEFENLPGFGKPLPEDDLACLPEEIRMAFRIMKNAGFSPEEANIKKELMVVEDLIKNCIDTEEKAKLQQDLNQKLLRYNQLLSKKRINTNSSIFKNYDQKIQSKFLK